MNDSILISVKKILGLAEEYEQFDADVVMHINSAFMALRQIGIGPQEGFFIEGKDEEWSDLYGFGSRYEAVKSYIALKVRLMFDPPASESLIKCINEQIAELEWRLCLEAGDN